MSKEELSYKVEYMEFTHLLKIKSEIMLQHRSIDYARRNLEHSTIGSNEMKRHQERIIKSQRNIDLLLDLVFLEGIS